MTITVNAVIETGNTTDETASALLTTLREATSRPELDFAAPPTVLRGGFYAEMRRFKLADPPPGLEGALVARIVPDPTLGEWEALVQGYVAAQGFATPSVRLVVSSDSPLGRYLIVMDAIDGDPPMAGLGITTVAKQIPNLLRRLPDQLASVAAALHALDPEPLAEQIKQLNSPIPATTLGFIEHQANNAAALGQSGLAAAGRRLLETEPASTARVISHGDLHPFNLLIADGNPVLIDWTVARIAHPAFTIAFTDLMLENPPIPLPRAGTYALGPVIRSISRRFLSRYRTLATPAGQITEETLAWHRKVHALRILVEVAGWDAAGSRPTHGHPWLILEPVARNELGLPTP